MRFLLDENVSDAVADLLRDRGHDVYLAREIIAPGTPDHILATISAIDSLILVTHDRDFKQFLNMIPHGHRARVAKGSGRLQLLINEATARQRLEFEIGMLEVYYERCLEADQVFFVTIQKSGVRWNY